MTDVRDLALQDAIRRDHASITHVNPRKAITCTLAGNTQQGSATAGARAGYVWFTDGSPRALGQAQHNNRVNPTAVGAHVWIAERVPGGGLAVIDTDFEANVKAGGLAFAEALAQVPITADYWMSLIPGDALNDLRVRPPDAAVGGLNVCIEAGRTEYGWLYKRHDSVAAYLPPTSGMRWWVLEYLDDTNTVQFSTTGSVETGMAAADMNLVPSALDAMIAALPDGSYPLYGFILENGQTEITAANTLFKDARFHYARKSSVVTPTDVTDKIMTTADGFLMVDADGYVMVSS